MAEWWFKERIAGHGEAGAEGPETYLCPAG
jgi:hypothetical protein